MRKEHISLISGPGDETGRTRLMIMRIRDSSGNIRLAIFEPNRVVANYHQKIYCTNSKKKIARYVKK